MTQTLNDSQEESNPSNNPGIKIEQYFLKLQEVNELLEALQKCRDIMIEHAPAAYGLSSEEIEQKYGEWSNQIKQNGE